MTILRNWCTGQWPVHFCQNRIGRGVAIAAAVMASAPATAATTATAAMAVTASAAAPAPAAAARPGTVGQTVADFYRARRNAPLWFGPAAGDSAQQLITLLSGAGLDGINPARYQPLALQQALATARSGKRKDLERADQILSQAFAVYVSDMMRDPGVGITYVDVQLWPTPPSALATLLQASAAPSLSEYVRTLGWMHPIYGQLRAALAQHKYGTDQERALLELNLKRVRALPAAKDRYVLVNAAQQRLYMYDGGKPVDSMVVVVGKPKWATPMLTAYIRYAALNPYWYVPPDLAGEDVGQFVVKQGLPYLDKMGYQVVSDWSADPTIIDPKTVDWKAVVDGKTEVMIRQKPGPQNFMGRMKFMFPNQFGVYLHDNPRRELFLKSTRYFSGGCVRLEDAARLGRWLFGRELDWQSAGPEEPVPLARPVPVYITYLTAMPDGQSIAFYEDVYGRDTPRMAVSATAAGAAAR
ncbi:MAG: L,D-transpeptidase family protein [Sphingomicrobium sp.]